MIRKIKRWWWFTFIIWCIYVMVVVLPMIKGN